MTIDSFPKWATTAVFCVLIALPAAAQDYNVAIKDSRVEAIPVNQPAPGFPRKGIRRGQEGWVQMSFVVKADGSAIDPIIIDSIGGPGFERAARDIVSEWQFETRESPFELPNNTIEIRFETEHGRDMATSNFMRRYRRIVTLLANEENEAARALVDQTQKLGGWNLYESTILWLMIGRVDGVEGNNASKLENYRRSLRLSNRNALKSQSRRDLLTKIIELEYEHGQYAAAFATLSLLRNEADGDKNIAGLQDQAAEIVLLLEGSDAISAKGVIQNACDCEEGEPIWSYAPVRRIFSFSNLNGNVDRFEARCRTHRLRDSVVSDKTWELPQDWGGCQIFVFGDDGASFDFVEHQREQSSNSVDHAAVADHHVLD